VINNCAENGALGVLPGIIGTWQALEAIKIITKIGTILSGQLLNFNALTNEVKTISFFADPNNKNIKSLEKSLKTSDLKDQTVDIYLLKEWMDTEDIQIIDVRDEYEFEDSNIGGLNIPLSALETTISKINRLKKSVVVCQSGVRSQQGLKIIRHCYPEMEIYHLKGGLNTYLL
jgi:adenylyltransferase/sulfurtransferase